MPCEEEEEEFKLVSRMKLKVCPTSDSMFSSITGFSSFLGGLGSCMIHQHILNIDML